MLFRMSHVVALGADDQASVRMPSADERVAYDIAEEEPVVEIRRWNGTTEVYPTRDTLFSFVPAGSEPDHAARLATIRQIVDDLREAVADGRQIPTEEQLVVRYGVSRTTLRRALAELRARGLLEA
jgi:DNA-binding GntR family transcriptional regulator